MGTSNSYSGTGGSNPLIPSWLDPMPQDGGENPAPPPPTGDPAGPEDPANGPETEPGKPAEPQPVPQPSQPPPVQPPDPQNPPQTDPAVPALPAEPHNPFRGARSAFSRYAGSGGSDRAALRKAVANYVSKSNGGAAQATRRMGASRSAASRLLGFLSDVQTRGAAEALKTLDLASLVGQSADAVFFFLGDYVCPTDGSVDAGIAREAFVEAIVEVANAGIASVEALTEPQALMIYEAFLTNSIFGRLCADIGNGIIQLSKDAKEAASIQSQIKSLIQGAVRDSVGRQISTVKSISQKTADSISAETYRLAFSVLSTFDQRKGKP